MENPNFDQPSALASGEVRGREACAASSPGNAVGGTDLSSPENRFHSRAKWGLSWTYLQNGNRLTDLKNELLLAREEEWGEGIVRESGTDMYTLLYLR